MATLPRPAVPHKSDTQLKQLIWAMDPAIDLAILLAQTKPQYQPKTSSSERCPRRDKPKRLDSFRTRIIDRNHIRHLGRMAVGLPPLPKKSTPPIKRSYRDRPRKVRGNMEHVVRAAALRDYFEQYDMRRLEVAAEEARNMALVEDQSSQLEQGSQLKDREPEAGVDKKWERNDDLEPSRDRGLRGAERVRSDNPNPKIPGLFLI